MMGDLKFYFHGINMTWNEPPHTHVNMTWNEPPHTHVNMNKSHVDM